jgi:UTP-glucose-1-phosphate uridylyltransferase
LGEKEVMTSTLVVLAAGIGSRYGGLKQMDPVGPNGEIIIDYSIYDAIKAGFEKVVFVIRKEIEKDFKKIVSSKYKNKIQVEHALQELDKTPKWFKAPANRQKPWGTGHAILTASELIDSPFAVINADDFYGRSGYLLLKKEFDGLKSASDNKFFMVGFEIAKTLSEHGAVSRGVCKIDADGYLSNVVERTKIGKAASGIFYVDGGKEVNLSEKEIVSMNMWGFTPYIFGHLRTMFGDFLKQSGDQEKSEFFIPNAVDSMIKSGKVSAKVLRSRDSWFGITYKEDKEMVKVKIAGLISKGVYPSKLF